MTNDTPQFPDTWQIRDYNPNDHLMSLKGRDYLNVQQRLLWFIRDQRDFIMRGLATCPYSIHTELVELDREHGFAHFKTYIRDVLGNETTAYGSETAKDFGDFAEKAGTKSEGRALLNMGYGTAFAPEMDEGERVVDSPVERRAAREAQPAAAADVNTDDEPATAEQQERMRKYREALGISERAIAVTDNRLRYTDAEKRIHEYIAQWQKQKQLQEVR